MNPARLALIRHGAEVCRPGRCENPLVHELLGYIDELTGERDRARDLASRSEMFTNYLGVDYDVAAPEYTDPVEPVEWDQP